MLTGALLGYLSFWSYFFNRTLGNALTFAVYGAALLLLGRTWRTRPDFTNELRPFAAPFLWPLVAAIGYLALFQINAAPDHFDSWYTGQHFFTEPRPGDNVIPEIFAEKIVNRAPLRPFCCGGWLSSDRPPLQSGIYLLLHIFHKWIKHPAWQYQALGSVLECLWVTGSWCVLTTLGTSAPRVRQTVVLMMLSGFLFYNSVYVWPKLLAAAFVLFSISILVQVLRARRGINAWEAALAATSLGMAMLAHPGSSFSLFAFLLVVLANPKLFAARPMLLGAAVLAIVLLPWTAYQKFVDPPGNRLLKMHLAGAMDVDQRSFPEALRDAYRTNSLRKILEYKRRNFARLLGEKPLETFWIWPLLDAPRAERISRIEALRVEQREGIWSAIGLLNLGWIAWLIFVMSRRKLCCPVIPYAGWLIAAAVLNLIVWCLVYFNGGGTITTHGSYADILLLDLGLSGALLALPRAATTVVLLLQLSNLQIVWVFFTLHAQTIQWPFAVMGLGLVTALAALFICDTKKRGTDPMEPVPR